MYIEIFSAFIFSYVREMIGKSCYNFGMFFFAIGTAIVTAVTVVSEIRGHPYITSAHFWTFLLNLICQY